MGYSTKTLLGYQFACLTADAVSLVLDADERSLEVLYEFHLPFG